MNAPHRVLLRTSRARKSDTQPLPPQLSALARVRRLTLGSTLEVLLGNYDTTTILQRVPATCSRVRYNVPVQGHRVERSTPGHTGPVYACDRAGVRAYVTAGKDGSVMLWDEELQKLKQVVIEAAIGCYSGIFGAVFDNMTHTHIHTRTQTKFALSGRGG